MCWSTTLTLVLEKNAIEVNSVLVKVHNVHDKAYSLLENLFFIVAHILSTVNSCIIYRYIATGLSRFTCAVMVKCQSCII